jgi:hypothetical protein
MDRQIKLQRITDISYPLETPRNFDGERGFSQIQGA